MRIFLNILITLIIYGAFVAPLWIIEPIQDCEHETVYSNAAWVYFQIFFILVFGAFLSKIHENVRRITNKIYISFSVHYKKKRDE
jgi:hypothetical protein